MERRAAREARTAGTPRATASFILTINASAFVVPPQAPRQRVKLALNGRAIGELTYVLETAEARTLEVATGAYKPGASTQLSFDLPDHVAPSQIGVSANARKLAIGLRSIDVRYPVYKLFDNE